MKGVRKAISNLWNSNFSIATPADKKSPVTVACTGLFYLIFIPFGLAAAVHHISKFLGNGQ